jgi:ComF family protein
MHDIDVDGSRNGIAEAATAPAAAGRAVGARRLVASAARAVADFIVPPVCVGCHKPLAAHDTLCADCWRGIDFIRPPLCDRLGLPMPFDTGGTMISAAAAAAPPVYGRARAVARYDTVMRSLIRDYKFHDQHHARRLFGRWLAAAGDDLIPDAELIVPVPMARLRLLWRRFNQSAELAAELGRITGLPSRPLALVRTRRTRPQPGLSREQRRENVRGAFAVPRARAADVAGRAVLLLDDVVTTGATADACARALKAAGALRVDVLALALVTDHALGPR